MLFLVLVSAFVVTTYVQAVDPTKICMPDVLETEIYSIGRQVGGVLAYDFTQKIAALHYENDLRLVYDFTDVQTLTSDCDGLSASALHVVKDMSCCLQFKNSLAFINDTDGSCELSEDNIYVKNMGLQCLPADAKPVGDDPIYLGLIPYGIAIEGWEFDLPNFGNVKVGITKTTPAIPVLRQYKTTGPLGSDVEMFFNPKTTIDDRSIFNIPAVCPPSSIVG